MPNDFDDLAAGAGLLAIDHIVVLMLENRSFDTMLGFLYTDEPPPREQEFDGLTGNESNFDSKGDEIRVWRITPKTPCRYLKPGHDPAEGFLATNRQLFGKENPVGLSPNNEGFVTDFELTLQKTAERPTVCGTKPRDIMGMYGPETLPILSGLARGFAVCDRWFASVPTMTLPNRAFACAATSLGSMDDRTKFFDCPSIFGLLEAHGLDWRIYGYDLLPMEQSNFPDVMSAAPHHFGVFSDFRKAAKEGALPELTWLEPSWGAGSNSQAPTQDVALGERYMHDVYYALRSGLLWERTLLFITYDEHGGCYDHVHPPDGAQPPDDIAGEFGFNFRRFGVRVPTVLVSPRIAKGSVVRAPGDKPPFDHTSILATIEKRWDLPPLTRRDASAADVGSALTTTSVRVDDPLHAVSVPRGTPSPVSSLLATY